MPQVVIENPILNPPFREPSRHFDFTDDGISDRVIDRRRPSSYFVPIPAAKKKGKQLQFETEWTKDRIEETRLVNQIRERVSMWRQGGHVGVTPVTERLLRYWTDPHRDKPLFFCQIEAVETAIYLTEVAKKWMQECLVCKDNTFQQLLLLIEFAHDAADRIYRAIVASTDEEQTLKPILQPYDTLGSTRWVDFDTTRPVYPTRPDKCHISHVVADTGSWEQKLAQTLEDMDEVVAYVKNHNLGFTIPYTLNGDEHAYHPDFIVRINPAQVADTAAVDGRVPLHAGDGSNGSVRLQPDPLNLIVEVSGQAKKDKAAKVTTARTLWVPAVNGHGGFGRWVFVEVTDPWDAANTIRAALLRQVQSGNPGVTP